MTLTHPNHTNHRFLHALVGLIVLVKAAPAWAYNDWYESLHPATQKAFERHAGDYLSVNGYLWSAATLRRFKESRQGDDRHAAVTGQTPFFYDPATGTTVSTVNEMIDATPGVDRLICVVVTIHEDGTLVRLEDGRLALLFDHDRDRVDGDWLSVPVMRAGRHRYTDDRGTPRTIARYEPVPVRDTVTPAELAHWFADHGVDRFVRFDLKKAAPDRAGGMNRPPNASRFEWRRRETVVPYFNRAGRP